MRVEQNELQAPAVDPADLVRLEMSRRRLLLRGAAGVTGLAMGTFVTPCVSALAVPDAFADGASKVCAPE